MPQSRVLDLTPLMAHLHQQLKKVNHVFHHFYFIIHFPIHLFFVFGLHWLFHIPLVSAAPHILINQQLISRSTQFTITAWLGRKGEPLFHTFYITHATNIFVHVTHSYFIWVI